MASVNRISTPIRRSVARFAAVCALLAVAICGLPGSAVAQAVGGASLAPAAGPMEVFTTGEWERYLRTLQNLGLVENHPWAIRGFSAGDLERLSPADEGHPWARRMAFSGGGGQGLRYGALPVRAVAHFNSSYPWGGNDGALWAGRGLTTGVDAGGWLRWGPLTVVLAPTAFRAENQAFSLAPNGLGEAGRFRSPLSPNNVDLPQRFGDGAYQRVDWGHSEVRLAGMGVAAGISGAPMQWGPGEFHPLVLGANAGGFSHLFLGTDRPVPVGIGTLHMRYFLGRLEQSEWAPTGPVRARRLGGGIVATFTPRGVPGLEIGGTRFLHREWPEDGFRRTHFTLPFELGFKESIPDYDERNLNQLASVFWRVNAPGSGFELFGEFVRIDHSHTSRVFYLEPDDLAGMMFGFRRALAGDGDRLTVIRGEALATVSSHRERTGARLDLAQRGRPMYQHGRMVQGHTHRGQLLVSPAGHGGHAQVLGVDRYDGEGRWSVEVERRQERDRTTGVRPSDSTADAEVHWALTLGGLRDVGRMELEGGLTTVRTFNRHLADDRWNVRLTFGARARLP